MLKLGGNMLGLGRNKKEETQLKNNKLLPPEKSKFSRVVTATALILLSSALGGEKKSYAKDEPADPVPVVPGTVRLNAYQYDAVMHVVRNHPEAGHFLDKVNREFDKYKSDEKKWNEAPVNNKPIHHPRPIFTRAVRSAAIDVVEARFKKSWT